MFRGMYKDKFRGMYKDKFRGMCLDMFRGMYTGTKIGYKQTENRKQTENKQTDSGVYKVAPATKNLPRSLSTWLLVSKGRTGLYSL